MNKHKIVIVVVLLSFLFTACSAPKEGKVKVSELMDSISEKIAKDYKTTKEQLGYNRLDIHREEGKNIASTMKLKEDVIEEGIYLTDPTEKTSNRVMIAKAKKDTNIRDVVKAFEKMKESQEKEWKKKRKEEYKKVKDGIIETNGRYVIYMVYDDMASIMKMINDKIAKSKKS